MIARILIRQLYDTYNYDIQFPENQRVTIITGPNGYGKTTFLKIKKLARLWMDSGKIM